VTSKTWALVKQLRFLQLTLYMIFFMVALPFLGHEFLLRFFTSIFLLNALLVTLSASGKKIRMQWLLWCIFAAATILTVLFLYDSDLHRRILYLEFSNICNILLLLLCLGNILAFIFESRQVTVDIIFAAIVAYLLIAFVFSEGYLLLHNVSPHSFNIAAGTSPPELEFAHGTMIYYSFITITTVGLGDILPQTPVARTMTILEAMIGQFFVAILVAWLVGRFISQEKKSS
jgi:voltage-gated potassium channel